MEVSAKTIEYLAALSRLHLTEDEKKEFANDLGRIISYMDKLKEVNTDDVEPLLQMTDFSNRGREDKAGDLLSAEEALRNAPERQGGFFSVPLVK
jgi:aspartyl-tRNA(Asn)/glutamyl-tRNA(Gln) amidotransferase subunit C